MRHKYSQKKKNTQINFQELTVINFYKCILIKKPNRSGKGRFGFLWLLGVGLVAAAAEDAEEEEEEVDEIEVEIHRAHRSETVSHSGIEI